MEKYAAYNEKEVQEMLNNCYNKLEGIADDLAMFTQQLEGRRENITPEYIEKTAEKVNNIILQLNQFGIDRRFPQIDIKEKIKKLDEMDSGDLY